MLTNEQRSQIDRIWNAFWTGGISNPLTVIEQITYLLFIKRLDDIQLAKSVLGNFNKLIFNALGSIFHFYSRCPSSPNRQRNGLNLIFFGELA